jgi:hypothetical protein
MGLTFGCGYVSYIRVAIPQATVKRLTKRRVIDVNECWLWTGSKMTRG